MELSLRGSRLSWPVATCVALLSRRRSPQPTTLLPSPRVGFDYSRVQGKEISLRGLRDAKRWSLTFTPIAFLRGKDTNENLQCGGHRSGICGRSFANGS